MKSFSFYAIVPPCRSAVVQCTTVWYSSSVNHYREPLSHCPVSQCSFSRRGVRRKTSLRNSWTTVPGVPDQQQTLTCTVPCSFRGACPSTMASVSRKEFQLKDAPVTRVVAYRDRAEITRTLSLEAAPAGDLELVLLGLTTLIEPGSLRVEGKGSATIVDVSLSAGSMEVPEEPKTVKKEKKSLRDKLEILQQKKSVEDFAVARFMRQLVFWENASDKFAKNMFGVHEGKPNQPTGEACSSVSEFLRHQEDESEKIVKKLSEKQLVLKELQESIESVQQEINGPRTPSIFGLVYMKWNVTATVKVEAESDLELAISYVVRGQARWNPKYDIRMLQLTNKLEITYYGIISQSTGEDWTNVSLSLSTAQPAVGGNIPVLGAKQVSFKPDVAQVSSFGPPPATNGGGLFGVAPTTAASSGTALFGQTQQQVPFGQCGAGFAMKSSVADVNSESDITTSFDIAKLTSIPSDNAEHKVTVGILSLLPVLRYKIVPRKAERAFLEARATNTSSYPILAGPASVFVGSTFVATVDLKTISPDEEFSCSLGVDPAVKVKYGPVRRFNEQTGLLSKSNVVTHVQEIKVNNTRSEPIRAVIVDQVPFSTDEKLRVTLIEPPLSQEKKEIKGFVLNQDNNVEHSVDIKERSPYVWTIKYKMEYPPDKTIQETELPATQQW